MSETELKAFNQIIAASYSPTAMATGSGISD